MATGDLTQRRTWANKWLVKLTREQKDAKRAYEKLSRGLSKRLKTLAKQTPAAKGMLEFQIAEALAKDEKYGQAAAAMAGARAAPTTIELTQPTARPGPESNLTPEERFQKLQENKLLLAQAVHDLDASIAFLESQPGDDATRNQLVQQLKARCAKAAEELRFAGVDAKDPYRAALVKQQVRAALGPIEDKIQALGLDATPSDGPTLMEKLGAKLNKIVDEMVSEALFAYLKEQGKAAVRGEEGSSYAETMEELVNGGGAALFQRFPNLQQRIELETRQFQNNIGEVLEAAAHDKASLATTFFGKAGDQAGNQIVGLKDLIVADSDPHNGGRRVTILTFVDTAKNEHKVVNKPRDVHVDAKLVGCGGNEASLSGMATNLLTKAAQEKAVVAPRAAERVKRARALLEANIQNYRGDDEYLAQTSDADLAALLWPPASDEMKNLTNKIHEDIQAKDMKIDVRPLPSYKYLPMEPQRPGEHPYGWVEFVKHGEPSDFVVGEEGARNFYRQAGRQAAMAFLFGIEDIHQGNIIVSKGEPQLTDLEIAFSTKAWNAKSEAKNRIKLLLADPAYRAEEFDGVDVNKLDDWDVEQRTEGRIKNLSVLAKAEMIGGLLTNTMIEQGLTGYKQTTHESQSAIRGDRMVANSTPQTEANGADFDQTVKNGEGEELTDNQLVYRAADDTLHSHIENSNENPRQKFGGEMIAGFQEMIEAFSDPAAAPDLQRFVDSFQDVHVRYHALRTDHQLNLRRNNLLDGFSDDTTDDITRSLAKAMKGHKGGAQIQASMEADLKAGDVAYYTQRLGSKELLHNGQDPVKEDGQPYFESDGLAPVKERLRLLGDSDFRAAVLAKGREKMKNIQDSGGDPRAKVVTDRVARKLNNAPPVAPPPIAAGPPPPPVAGPPPAAQPPPPPAAPPTAPLAFGDLSRPNPTLYFIPNSDGGTNYRVDSHAPGGAWQPVEQFCAYLAAEWLGNGAGGALRFTDVGADAAVATLIGWGAGGKAAQVGYARDRISGQDVAPSEVLQRVTDGFPAGTLLWFGTDRHAQAAAVQADGNYRVYDPDTGNVQTLGTDAFKAYIGGQTTFVVA